MEKWNGYRIIAIVGLRQHGKTNTLIRDIMPEYIYNRYGTFKFTAEEAAKNKNVEAGKPYIKMAVIDLEYNYNYQSFECLRDKKFPADKKELLRRFVKTPVPVISLSQFPTLSKGAVRVLPRETENGDEFATQAMYDVCYNRKIKNCLAVFEDTARFLPGNNTLDKITKGICINTKQRGMDVVLMFHDWMDVPPNLLRWIDDVYLHKVENPISIRDKKIGEAKIQKLQEAEKRINNHPDKYYHEKITLIA